MAKYKFKGYTIECCGYHQPDHCVWWEAVDDSGAACFHGNTLREVEFMIIDSEWEDKLKAKDAEIAGLREKMGDDDLLKMASDIEKLNAKLKVAEDALSKCVNYNNSWELLAAEENAKKALAAIRVEQ